MLKKKNMNTQNSQLSGLKTLLNQTANKNDLKSYRPCKNNIFFCFYFFSSEAKLISWEKTLLSKSSIKEIVQFN